MSLSARQDKAPSEPRLRILLADDHAVMREGLAMLINSQPDMTVIAQVTSGREAISFAARNSPDVAVLDISMPDIGGAEATAQISIRCPHTRILVLTRHNDISYLQRLLQAGAHGYVLKKSAADDMIEAIRCVARGQQYVEPKLAADLLARRRPRRAELRDSDIEHLLSEREKQVLRSIAWGRGNKEIARDLELSVKTVESYKATAMGKLDFRSRRDIVRFAVELGWLADDQMPERDS